MITTITIIINLIKAIAKVQVLKPVARHVIRYLQQNQDTETQVRGYCDLCQASGVDMMMCRSPSLRFDLDLDLDLVTCELASVGSLTYF